MASADEIQYRLATEAQIDDLEALIELSSRKLQSAYYSDTQLDAAIGTVFGVDSALIGDGTYYAVMAGDTLAGCGGWSRRATLFGSDRRKDGKPDPLLDPATDAARIRAFFVHPDWTRRGIGRRLIELCEGDARAAGFERMELAATLAGVPLYAAAGYVATRRFDTELSNGEPLPIVHMAKPLV